MRARGNRAHLVLLPLILASCQSQAEGTQHKVLLIDNMEHENASFRWGTNNAWRGVWYASTQETHYQEGSLWPAPILAKNGNCDGWAFDWITEEPLDDGLPHPAGGQAAHLHTPNGGLLLTPPGEQGMDWGDPNRVWGANISVDLTQPGSLDAGRDVDSSSGLDGGSPSDDERCPLGAALAQGVSLEPYTGLGFWARAAGEGAQTIHVQLQDVESDLRGERCVPSTTVACYNGFAKPITLTESFKRYEVDFSELRRDPNWGNGNLMSLNKDKVYMLSFEVRSPKCIADDNGRCAGKENIYLRFDIWVDSVYLYSR
jgi:hypothetical protein